VVLAAEEDERITGKYFHSFDFSKKNGVIAGHVGGDNVAGHLHQCVVKKGYAAGSPAKADAESGFGVVGLLGLREEFGNALLARFEDADAEAAALIEDREHLRALGDAYEREKWFERDGGEGVCGHAMDAAGGTLGGDDGNAGGEIAASVAEFDGSQRGGSHS